MPEKADESKSLSEEKFKHSSDNDDKNSKDKRKRKDKIKPLTKVIIRRLPPTMTEDVFLKQIEPIPDYDYFYFVSADMSLRENASARAYINFCQQDDIFIFKDKFDGYVFVDNKGVEYPAIVEFAPFQGLVKIKSRKKDNKCNTIEADAHFMEFLESLKQNDVETGKQEMKLEYSYQIKDDKKITSTPLLEYLLSKKQARREERRKKIDDRKKQRDDEKIRKQNHVSKNIPPSIQEEDDGIIVRTIKSRSFERGVGGGDRSKNKERVFESSSGKTTTKSDEKYKAYREERDRKRDERRKVERERRDEQREQRQKTRDEQSSSSQQQTNKNRDDNRDRNRKDRSSGGGGGGLGGNDRGGAKGGFDRRDQHQQRNKDDKKADVIPSSTKLSSTTDTHPPIKEEKVKKYSESRRERFNRSADANKTSDGKSGKKDNEDHQEKFFGKDNKNDGKFSGRYKSEKSIKEEKTVVKDTKVHEKEIVKEPEEDKIQKSDENVKDATKQNIDELKSMPNETENYETDAIAVDSQATTKLLEHQSSVDDGRRSSSSGESGCIGKDDAQMKRIRNKDRPSLQIYQPGKRRLAPSTSSSNVTKKEIESFTPPPIVGDGLAIGKQSPKVSPSTSLQTINDALKVDDDDADKNKSTQPAVAATTSKVETIQKDTATIIVSSADISDEVKKTEKKVKRYSERRTRARERRGSKSDKIADPDENNIVGDDVPTTSSLDENKLSEVQSVDKMPENEADDIKPEIVTDTIKTDE